MRRLFAVLLALTLPQAGLAWQGGGNEPFWSVRLAAGEMRITRLGLPDLTLAIMDAANDGGALRITAGDPAHARDAVLTRRPALCRDSMSGMPHPETVTLALGKDWFTGCGGAPVDLLAARAWRIAEIAGAPVMAGLPLVLRFDARGRMAGHGGCNGWFAGYDLNGEGLVIGPVGATRMACARPIMDQEARLFAALARVTRFDLTDAGDLVLLAGETPVLLAQPVP